MRNAEQRLQADVDPQRLRPSQLISLSMLLSPTPITASKKPFRSKACTLRLYMVRKNYYLSHSYSYSMGQTIKSVCVCECVSLSVCLRALSRSHFLIDFHQNWHIRNSPKRKNEFVRDQYRTTPSLFYPTKFPF